MIYRFGRFELDASTMTLRAARQRLDIPRKAVEMLAVLIEREGVVVSKRVLMETLWPDGFVEEANLTQYVYLLRRAFRKECGVDPIRTHPRSGYEFRWAAPSAVGINAGSIFAIRLAGAALATAAFLLAGLSGSADARRALPAQVLQTYQLGEYFWNLRSVAGMERSVGYFRRVVHAVPNRAIGYAALANAYTELADFERPCSLCASWARQAEWAARRALALEPDSPDARVAWGMVARIFRNDDATAAREFRAAIAADPKDALAHQWYGNLLVAQGSLWDGRRQLEEAAALDPISTATYAWLARANYYERRYADAERYARQALALEPTRLETTVLLGDAQEEQGHFSAALHSFDAAARLGAAVDALVLRSTVYSAMGKRSIALAMLKKIQAEAEPNAYALRDMVLAYDVAGSPSEARIRLLRLRFQTRLDRELFALDPRLENLHAEIIRAPALRQRSG